MKKLGDYKACFSGDNRIMLFSKVIPGNGNHRKNQYLQQSDMNDLLEADKTMMLK